MRAAISACSVSGIRSARRRRRPRRASASSPRRRAGCPRSSRAAPRARSTGSVAARRGARRRAPRSRSGAQRLELDRGRAHAAAAPAGADVEQLGPREADEQQRRLAHPGGEVLDQLEQRLLGPVDVLEDEHERLLAARAARPTRARPRRSPAGCARPRRPRARRRRGRAGRRPPRPRSRSRSFSIATSSGSSSAIPAARLDHLGERPVRDALAVREAAARRARSRPRAPAMNSRARRLLPTPGLAVDRERGARGGRGAARSKVFCEQVELGVAADRAARRSARARAARPSRRRPRARPRSARRGRELERADVLDLDPAEREPRAPGPIRISPGSAACCSRAARLTASPVAKVDSAVVGDDLARLDPDAGLELELVDAVEDRRARRGPRARRRPRAPAGCRTRP